MVTHEWIAPSGVRVVSCRPRNDAGGVRGFLAYLGYYWLEIGRSKGTGVR